jgi:hypothetical protein
MGATWLANVIGLGLITLIIFGEAYKLLSSSSCILHLLLKCINKENYFIVAFPMKCPDAQTEGHLQ